MSTAMSRAESNQAQLLASAALLWIDGERVDSSSLHLSAFDRGFTLGDGVFETMRAYAGVPFRLRAHIERLQGGAARLGFDAPAGLERLVTDAMREAAASGLVDAALRLTVTRGPAAPGLAPPRAPRPTTVLTIHSLPILPPTLYEAGLAARVATGRRNEHAATAGIKTVSYGDAIVALAQARQAGDDEAIFLDTAGHVSEATASNLFVCLDDRLVTPPESCGILAGITRQAVLDLAPTCDCVVEERVLSIADLLRATEAFLTSSVREIVPLTRIDGHPVGTGARGPLTARIQRRYAELVRRGSAP